MNDDETRARAALAWAIEQTVLRLPPTLRRPGGWTWDAEDLSLVALRDEGAFRFYVAAERLGARRRRLAVMSITDDCGKVEWEAPIPEDADA